MEFFNVNELREKGRATDIWRRKYASLEMLTNFSEILNESKTPSDSKKFDIFLSHSFNDRDIILGLRQSIVDKGFSVYVDWIEDAQLDRNNVSRETVEIIRKRMNNCKSLIYAFSDNAKESTWMPWELGFMDGIKEKKVAIMQINESNNANSIIYERREYLSIYYVVDKSAASLWINADDGSYVNYKDWLNGKDPIK